MIIGTLVSLNTALPSAVQHNGKEVMTGIFKSPVGAQLRLGAQGLEGDGQADLVNHGGADKAVCVYPLAHYAYWEQQWGRKLAPGAFGENFTVSELTEETLAIGDIVQVGAAVVQVSQPRQPCFKLGMKHQITELPLDVQRTGFTGFYFRVLREGLVAAGDELRLLERHTASMTVARANRVMYDGKQDRAAMESILAVQELSESWRSAFLGRLSKLDDPQAGHGQD